MIEIARTNDLEACRRLRRIVFIDEQHVSEADEMDGLDDKAVHMLAREDGNPLGSARLFVKGDIGKIGRVCVLASARGRGLGAALITESEKVLAGLGCIHTQLGAQCHAIPFYEKLGYTVIGPIYDDAGIPHRDMQKSL